MSSYEYALQMNRYFLIPIGIWALDKEDSLILRFLRNLMVVLCYWLICFLLVPCGLHMFLEEHDPAMKLKLIGPLSFCLMAIAKYCSFVNKTREIRDCLQHLQDDWQLYSQLGNSKVRGQKPISFLYNLVNCVGRARSHEEEC